MIALVLLTFYAFSLVSPFALGKLLAVSLVGMWLAMGRVYRIGVLPAAYLFALCLTTWTSADPWASYWGHFGSNSDGLLCALALVPFLCCVGPDDWGEIEGGLDWGGVVVSVVGLLQLAGFFLPFPLFDGNRVYSTLGAPWIVGVTLAMCFPFSRSWWKRGLLIAGLWASGSRGAWVATAAGMIYWHWPKLSRRVRVWGLVATGAGLALALWLRPLSDLGRVVTWAAAIEGFKSRPWLGWGTGNYGMIATLWRNPIWDEVYGNTTQGHAHNVFLEAAATSGLVGLVTVCGLLWAMWRDSNRQARAAFVGVFICAMLNPLPLVVKALVLMLAASSEDHEWEEKP